MPLKEVEIHPYLQLQSNSKSFSSNLINKMIVGTFPIYCIADSNPVEEEGIELRQNYLEKARFKFFYGSRLNSFWNYLASCFKNNIPNDEFEAIEYLNRNNIFITDVYSKIIREKYSSSDKDLKNPEYNLSLITWIKNMKNLDHIIFTSVLAKRMFCKIIDLNFSNIKTEDIIIYNKRYNTSILPSPGGNGRSIRHFFNSYPLVREEIELKNAKLPYANIYRNRIYSEVLKS
ncbi:hypothetical protein [Flavobacterium sp. NRK1]|uniref:hypothetical protein n=1 Tax=Flavobacterium sp. NRK1 TaxID=2954929 RepID=UPI002091FE48|nr:hypothetical protein [Flavobacterium sp. NRK1]MCO6147326.1 hypothetical protein [Flavobacterium sp. NRK1]